MGKQSSQLIMKTVLMFTCLVLAVSAQQRGGLQCSDGNKPTCTCDNGTVVTRPRFNPCGDRTKPVLMVLVQHVPMVWLQCAEMDLLPIHQPFLPALMVCPGVRMVEEYLVLMEPASLDSWPVLWVNSQIVLTYLVPYFHLAHFTQIRIKS